MPTNAPPPTAVSQPSVIPPNATPGVTPTPSPSLSSPSLVPNMARTLLNNGTLQQQHVQQHVAQLAAQAAAGNQLGDSAAGLSQQQLLRVYSSLIGKYFILPYLTSFDLGNN